MQSKRTAYASVLAFLIILLYVFFSSPPSNFPVGTIVTISPGQSLSTIASNLKGEHIVASSFLFRSGVILLGGENKVIAGDYLLDHRDTVFTLAYRLVHGSFHLVPVKITIPEGWSVSQIGAFAASQFKGFDEKTFVTLAKPDEGYLFPDTYFISPLSTPDSLIARMKGNFDAQIATIPTIQTSSHSLKDIIIMASILEGEASITTDRRIIAGILWKRISIGMPLQVDSTFLYINGKTTYQLTEADLQINSPYNTYRYAGLPPTPIDNPGKDSIIAATMPIDTDYLYFFSGTDGTMHYAKTFEDHKKNIAKYAKK